MKRKCLAAVCFTLMAMVLMCVSGVMADSITVEDVTFTDAASKAIYKTYDGTVIAKAEINAEGSEEITMITAVFDVTGKKLQDVDYKSVKLTAGNAVYSSDNVTAATGSSVKVMFFGKNDNKPLSTSYSLTNLSSDTSLIGVTAAKDSKTYKSDHNTIDNMYTIYANTTLDESTVYTMEGAQGATINVDRTNNTCTVTAENGTSTKVYPLTVVDAMTTKFYADFTGSEIVCPDGTLDDGTFYADEQANCPSYGINFNNNEFNASTYGSWWRDTLKENITVSIADDPATAPTAGNKALSIDKSVSGWKVNTIRCAVNESDVNTATTMITQCKLLFIGNSDVCFWRMYFGGMMTSFYNGEFRIPYDTGNMTSGTNSGWIPRSVWQDVKVIQKRTSADATPTAEVYLNGKLFFAGAATGTPGGYTWQADSYTLGQIGLSDDDAHAFNYKMAFAIEAASKSTIATIAVDDLNIWTK